MVWTTIIYNKLLLLYLSLSIYLFYIYNNITNLFFFFSLSIVNKITTTITRRNNRKKNNNNNTPRTRTHTYTLRISLVRNVPFSHLTVECDWKRHFRQLFLRLIQLVAFIFCLPPPTHHSHPLPTLSIFERNCFLFFLIFLLSIFSVSRS